MKLASPWPNETPQPESIEEVTPAFLTIAFQRVGVLPTHGAVVSKVTKAGDSSKQGQCSYMAFLNIEYEGSPPPAAPRELAGKFLPRDGESGDSPETAANYFPFEVAAYKEIPDVHGFLRPRVYYCEKSLILMERLPGVSLDIFSNNDLDTIRSVLRSLASLHARFWGGPAIIGGKHNVGASVMQKAAMKEMFRQCVPAIPMIMQAHPSDDANVKAVLDGLQTRFDAAFGQWFPQDQALTLCFGDAKLDNVFRLDGDVLKFVDFTGMAWTICADDIMFFLVSSLPHEQYADNWEKLIQYYHKELVSSGVCDYPYELLRKQYVDRVGLMIITLAMLAPMVIGRRGTPAETTKHGRSTEKLFSFMADNLFTAIRVHDTASSLLALPENKELVT